MYVDPDGYMPRWWNEFWENVRSQIAFHWHVGAVPTFKVATGIDSVQQFIADPSWVTAGWMASEFIPFKLGKVAKVTSKATPRPNLADNVLNSIMKNPANIHKYSVKQIEAFARNSSQWTRKEARKGAGFRLARDGVKGQQIRFSQGGRIFDATHNFGKPYWVISSGRGSSQKFWYLF